MTHSHDGKTEAVHGHGTHNPKHHIEHAHTAKNDDGSYDVAKIAETAGKALENIRNGHAKIELFTETTLPNGHRRLIMDVSGH